MKTSANLYKPQGLLVLLLLLQVPLPGHRYNLHDHFHVPISSSSPTSLTKSHLHSLTLPHTTSYTIHTKAYTIHTFFTHTKEAKSSVIIICPQERYLLHMINNIWKRALGKHPERRSSSTSLLKPCTQVLSDQTFYE